MIDPVDMARVQLEVAVAIVLAFPLSVEHTAQVALVVLAVDVADLDVPVAVGIAAAVGSEDGLLIVPEVEKKEMLGDKNDVQES